MWRSFGMFYNPKTGVISILVANQALTKSTKNKHFIHIPPNCTDLHVAADAKTLLDMTIKSKRNGPWKDLLINRRETFIDKLYYSNSVGRYICRIFVHRFFRSADGDTQHKRFNDPTRVYMVIDQPVDLDSVFGPLQGTIIHFGKVDVDRIRKNLGMEKHLAKNSILGKRLTEYSRFGRFTMKN